MEVADVGAEKVHICVSGGVEMRSVVIGRDRRERGPEERTRLRRGQKNGREWGWY